MKKFLVFLFSIVVVVCLGLTTYYFMRNNEIITIKTKEIFCNAGDTIPLKSLGIKIEKANISKKTKFNYNAGGEDVTKYIEYNEESSSFVVSNEYAGEVTLVISTTNEKYPDFTINVHIGNGSLENPYYIFNESDLSKIGSVYRLDKHYKLMKDISLTPEFAPIGYNHITSTWDGFNGSFNGQGYTIKGLTLNNVETDSIGLFSSLKASSKVTNLNIENATISGSYKNVGVLAGIANGIIEKVAVKNASITNTSGDSLTGALVGSLNGNLQMSFADNVEININGEEDSNIANATVGGLIGKVNQSLVQATYTNDVQINLNNASGIVGGFAGKFVIGTDNGSIQQSYANVTCSNNNYAAFIGEISKSNDFNLSKANMLKHLIGNIAVVYGRESQANIADNDLVKTFDNTFFKNVNYTSRSVFFDNGESALYLIRGFISAGEVVSTNEYIHYAIDMTNTIGWDTTYVWNVTHNNLPTLRMGNVYPTLPSGEYFRRDLSQVGIGTEETFNSIFSNDINSKNIKLLKDTDLTQDWNPISIVNSTFDGNNKTITINLNNDNNGLGLFNVIDNSTIKNLNIVVTGVSANATNAGALAGIIKSSNENTTSTIENVKVIYQNFATPNITNFGGLAGTVENAVITNCVVENLAINKNAKVEVAGAVAAILSENVKVENIEIKNSTVYGTKEVAGIAVVNDGVVSNVTGDVAVKYAHTANNASVAGLVATNNGIINDVDLTVNVEISNVGSTTNVAGVVATNNGTIENVKVSGDAIAITTKKTDRINVGGVVVNNNGTICNVVNTIKTVGTYYVNANHYVGGVAYANAGNIEKVVVTSDINGNNVSGIVATMNALSATIDQVVIGDYNTETRKLTQNEITADKYIAGIAVDFKAGSITNVQVASLLVGTTNDTRSSLATLIFAYGANLKNATIDSAFSGYGVRYRESWTDFASYNNKAEFGLANGETGDERFNVYKYDTYHGCMQSVVINGEGAGVGSAKAAMGSAFMFSKDYQDTADSSFIKVVNGFNDISQFQGEFTFVCSISTLGIEHKATKSLTFSLGNMWQSNNGISLMFLDEIFA